VPDGTDSVGSRLRLLYAIRSSLDAQPWQATTHTSDVAPISCVGKSYRPAALVLDASGDRSGLVHKVSTLSPPWRSRDDRVLAALPTRGDPPDVTENARGSQRRSRTTGYQVGRGATQLARQSLSEALT
jgi:hypothetical protein